MSTHSDSAIIMKTKIGYAGIYCHYDGYPSCVGKILQENYQDESKVKELIALGDISSLEKLVNPESGKHSYNDPQPGVTVAYYRDRGDIGCETKIGFSIKQVEDQIDNEYVYVFEDGKWTVNGKSLKVAIDKDSKR